MAIRPQPTSHSIAAQTITVAGDTGTLPNLCDEAFPRVVTALINYANAPTGTTPSTTPSLMGSPDGTVYYLITAGTAQTTAGQQRLVGVNVVEPFVKVSWPAPTGTTPSFTGVKIDIIFS